METENVFNQYDRLLMLLLFGLVSGLQGNVLTEFSHIIAFAFTPWVLKCLSSGTVIIKNTMIWFAVLIIYSALSLSWTPQLSYGVTFFSRLIVHLLICLEIILFAQKAESPFHAIAYGWVLAFALTSVMALWEIMTDQHYFTIAHEEVEYLSNRAGEQLEKHVAAVTFHNPNTYSLFAVSVLPFLLYLILQTKKSIKLLMEILLLLVLVYIVFMNSSRGCFLCLAVVFFVFFVFQFRKSDRKTKKRLKWMIFFIVVFLIVFGPTLFQTILFRAEGGAMFEDNSRMKLWAYTWQQFLESYGMGMGIGSMKPVMASFQGFWTSTIVYSHNMILELLLEGGILFGFFFISYLFSIIKSIKTLDTIPKKIVIYSVLFSLPFYTIVNSSYTAPTFIWCYFESIYAFCLPVESPIDE